MQVARMESDSDMVVKRLSVPMGLEELMESLTKEVLRRKPSDIYAFASEHFSQLLEIRDQGNGKGSLKRISKLRPQLSEDTTESTISKTNPVKVRTAVFATTSKVPRAMVRNKSPAPKSFLVRKNVPTKTETNIPRRAAVNTNTTSNRQERMKTIMEKRKANKKNPQDSKNQAMPEGQPSELESRKIVEFPRKTDSNKRRAEQRRQSLFQRKNEEGDNAGRTRSRSSSKSKQDDTFRTSTEKVRRQLEVLKDSKEDGAKANLKQTRQLKAPRMPPASEKTSPRNKNVNKSKKLPSNVGTFGAKDSGLVTADSKTKESNASSKIETSLSTSDVDEMNRNVDELETTMTSSVDSKQELTPKMEVHDAKSSEKVGVFLDDSIVTQMEQQELESSSIIESSKASGSGNEDSEVFGSSKIHEPSSKDEMLKSTVIDVDGKEVFKDSISDAVENFSTMDDNENELPHNKVVDAKADEKNIEIKDFLVTTNAAVKIQSLMRGYLARKAIQKIVLNSEGKEVVQDSNDLTTHIEDRDKSFGNRDNKTTKGDIHILETAASNKNDTANDNQIQEQSSVLKDDIADEIQSVVKIQALTRGYLTRKLIRKNKTADSKSESKFQDSEKHAPKSKLNDEVKFNAEKAIDLLSDGDISESVSSVQEVKVKCIVVENANQASVIPSEVPEKIELQSDNKELKEVSDYMDVDKAATLIQALYRGHLGRKAIKVLEQRELGVKDGEAEEFNNTVASQQIARAIKENKIDSNDSLRKGESVEDDLKVIDQFGEVFRKETANFLEQEHINYDSNRYDFQEKFDGNKPFGDNVKNRANSIEKLADVPNYLRNNMAEMRVEDLQKPPECDELPHQKGGTDVMRAAIVIQAIFRGYIARKRCEGNDQYSSKKRGFEGTLPPLFEVEAEDNKYAASSGDHDKTKESLSSLPNVENEPTETESSVSADNLNARSRCATVSDDEVFDILKKLDDVRIPEEEPRRKSKTYSRSLTFDDPSIQQSSINQLTKSMTFVVGDEFQRFDGSDSRDRSLESIETDAGSVSMKSTDSNKQSEEDNYITEIATAIKEDVQKLKETLESGIATSVVTEQKENDGNIAEITEEITEDIKQLEKTLKQDSGDFKNSLRETDSTEAKTRPVSKDSTTSTDSVDTVIFNDNYKKGRHVQIKLQQSTPTEVSSEDKTDKEADDRRRMNAIKAQGDILVSDILDTARDKLERENPDAEYFEEDPVMNQFTFDKRQSTTSDELRQLWHDEAATTIQKNYRGYRVRRDLENHKEEVVDVIKAKEERAHKEITRYLQQITEPIRRAFSAEKSLVNVDEGTRAFKKRAYSAEVEAPRSIYIPLRDYSDEEKEVLKEIPVIKSTSLEDVENIHVEETNNNDLALRTEEMKRNTRISESAAVTVSATDIQCIEDGKDKIEDADEKISSCISALIEPITKTFQPDEDLANTERPDVISEEMGPVYEYIPLRNYSEDKENENNSKPHLGSNIITSVSILKDEKEESKDTYGDVGVENEDEDTDKRFQYIYDQIVSESSKDQSTDQSFDKISTEIMEEGVESTLGDKPDKGEEFLAQSIEDYGSREITEYINSLTEPAKQTITEFVSRSTLKQGENMSLSSDKLIGRKQDEEDLEAIESKIYDSRNIIVGTQTRTAEAKGVNTGDKGLTESEVGGNEINNINIEIKTDNFSSLGEKEIDYLESSTKKEFNSHVQEKLENLLASVDENNGILNTNENVKDVKGSGNGEHFEDTVSGALGFSGLSDLEQHKQDSSKLHESIIATMDDKDLYTQEVSQIIEDVKNLESHIGEVFPIAADKLSQDQNLEASGNSNPASEDESKRNDAVKEIEEQKVQIEQKMKPNTAKDGASPTDDIQISESHVAVDNQLLKTPVENKTETDVVDTKDKEPLNEAKTFFIHEESTSDGKIIDEDKLSTEINELTDGTKAMLTESDKLATCVKKVELIDEDLDTKANLETPIVDSSESIIDIAYINKEDMKNEESQFTTKSGDVVEKIDHKVVGENLQSPSKSSRTVSVNESDKIEDTIDTSEQISNLLTQSDLNKLDEKEHVIVIKESTTDAEKNIESSISELVDKIQDIEQEQLFSGFDGRDPNGTDQESTTDELVTESDSISKMKDVIRVELKDKTEGENVTYIEENNNVINKNITTTDQMGKTSPIEGDATLEQTIDISWNDNVNTNWNVDKGVDAELEQTQVPSQNGSSKLDKISHDLVSKEHIQNISPEETVTVKYNKDKPDENIDMVLVEETQEASTNKTIESDETSNNGNVDVTSKEQVQNINADKTPTVEFNKDVTRDVTLAEQTQETIKEKTVESGKTDDAGNADIAASAGQVQNINADEILSIELNEDRRDITLDMTLAEQIQEATKSKSIELDETTEGRNIDLAPDEPISLDKTIMDVCNKDGTDEETCITRDVTLEQRAQEGIKNNIIELDKLAGDVKVDEIPKRHIQSISGNETTTDEFNKDKVKEEAATIPDMAPASKNKTIEIEQAVVDENLNATPKEHKEIVTMDVTATADFDENNVYMKIDISPAVELKEQTQEVGNSEIGVLGKVVDGGNDDVALQEHTLMDESISLGFDKDKVDEKTDIIHDVTLEEQIQEGGEKKIIELNTVMDDGHVDVATTIMDFGKGNAAEKIDMRQDVGLGERTRDSKIATTDGVIKDSVEANTNLLENVLTEEFQKEDLLIDGSQVRDKNQNKDLQSATSEYHANHKIVEEIIVKDVRDEYAEKHDRTHDNIKSDDKLDEKTGTKLKNNRTEVAAPKITVDGSQAQDKVLKDIITDNKLDEKSEIKLQNDQAEDTTHESTVDDARTLSAIISDNKLDEKYETRLDGGQKEVTTSKSTVHGSQAHEKVLKDIITNNKLDEKSEIKLENDQEKDTTLESTVDDARTLKSKTSDNKLNEKYEIRLKDGQKEFMTPKSTVDDLQARDRVLKDIIPDNKLHQKSEIKLKNDQEEDTTRESTVDGARTLSAVTSDNKLDEKYETRLEDGPEKVTTPKSTVDISQAHDRIFNDIITDNNLHEKLETKLEGEQKEVITPRSSIGDSQAHDRALNHIKSDNKLNQDDVTTPKSTIDNSQVHDGVLKVITPDKKLDQTVEIKLESDQEQVTTPKITVDDSQGHDKIFHDISDKKIEEKSTTKLERNQEELTALKSTVVSSQAHDGTLNNIKSDNELDEKSKTKLEGEQGEVTTLKSTVDSSQAHDRICNDSTSDYKLDGQSESKFEGDQEKVTTPKGTILGEKTLDDKKLDNKLDELSNTKLESDQEEVVIPKIVVGGLQTSMTIDEDEPNKYQPAKEIDSIEDEEFQARIQNIESEIENVLGKLSSVASGEIEGPPKDDKKECKDKKDESPIEVKENLQYYTQPVGDNGDQLDTGASLIDSDGKEIASEHGGNVSQGILKDDLTSHPKKEKAPVLVHEEELSENNLVSTSEVKGPPEDDKKECKDKKSEAPNEVKENLQSHTQSVGDNGDQLNKGASMIDSDEKEIASEHGGNVSEDILKDDLTSHSKKDEKAAVLVQEEELSENNLLTQLGLSTDRNSYQELDNNVEVTKTAPIKGGDISKQEIETETDGNIIISNQDQLPANIVVQEQEPKHQTYTESETEKEENQNDVIAKSLTDFHKDSEAVLKSNVVEIQKDSDHNETIDYKRSTAINKKEVISKDIETPEFLKTLTEESGGEVSTTDNIEQKDMNKHQLDISALDENKDNIGKDLTSSEIKKARDDGISSSESMNEGFQSDRNITHDDLPIEKHEPEATVADKDKDKLSTIEDTQKEDIPALQASKLKGDDSDVSKYKNELKEKESVNDELLQGFTEEPQLIHTVECTKSNDVKSSESEVIKEDYRKSGTGRGASGKAPPGNDSKFVGNLSEISQEISDVGQEKLTSVDPVKESLVTQGVIVNQDKGFSPDTITHQDVQEISSAKSELDESILNKMQNAAITSKDVIEAYEPEPREKMYSEMSLGKSNLNSTEKPDTVGSSGETDVTNVSQKIVSEPSYITQSNLIVSPLKEESTDMEEDDGKNVNTTITDHDRVQTTSDVAQGIATIAKVEHKDETGNDRKASEQLQEKTLTDPIRDRFETSSRNGSLELKQLETDYMSEENADLGKIELSSNQEIEKNSVDVKGELAKTKNTIVKGEDIPEQPEKEIALGSTGDQLNSQDGTNDMVIDKDESSELKQSQIDEKHGDAGDSEKIPDKKAEDIDSKNTEKLNGKPEEIILSGKEDEGYPINSREEDEGNLKTVGNITQPISPFYLHQDTFFQNASTMEQEKKFAEALKLSVDSKKQGDDGEIKEKLLHSSEFHDSIPIDVSVEMPEKHMTTQTNGTQCDISQERSTPMSTVLVHSGELHDNILPLALQMNQDPGIEIVTSSNTHQTSVGSILAAQASTKDVPAHFGRLATTRAQSKPDDMVRSMDTEKRNNSTLVKKNMESEAATKIQASFRGYQVRKQLKNKLARDNITNIKRTTRRKSLGRISDKSSNKQATDLEEQSATKIQAGIRGFLVRRRQKKTKPIRE